MRDMELGEKKKKKPRPTTFMLTGILFGDI